MVIPMIQDYYAAGLERNEEMVPSKTIGEFLHHLWPEASLFDCPSCDSQHTSSFKLFTAYNFNNLNKVCAVFSIFNGLPQSFQLLRCSFSTSEDDVELFFDRIDNFPAFQYLLLGVNLLSLEVQQVLRKNLSK